MFLYYLIFVLFNIIQIINSLDSCRQTFGSNKYDLNQLSRFTLLGDDAQFRYVLTPCGLLPTEQCGKPGVPFEPGMTACQERIITTTFESAMGFLDGYGKTPNLEFNENPEGPGTGVVMMMRNAKCNTRERPVKVTFICDKKVENPTSMEVVEDPICEFAITVKAAGACPLEGSKTEGGGVSGGTIFIIIFLVLIVVYLFGGILYNRFQKNETGLATLPHPSFWLLLVGLFVTGCRYTLSFVRNCGSQGSSKSSSSYESV